MQDQTPMMRQYHEIKSRHRDKILFFRLGDFYEMFHEDAREASRLLNITLTHRNGDPMCGIPYHSAQPYIKRLLDQGKRIAVCEQVSIPGIEKGIVKREVVEILTPGSVVEENFLVSTASNYTVALHFEDDRCALAVADLSTGEFKTTSFRIEAGVEALRRELGRFQPREVLVREEISEAYPFLKKLWTSLPGVLVTTLPPWYFDSKSAKRKILEHFGFQSLSPLSLHDQSLEVIPTGLLLEYWAQNSPGSALVHIRHVEVYQANDFLAFDDATARNLELTSNLRDQTSSFTLFEVLNHTKTAPGARLLRSWLLFPLKNRNALERRHRNVETFVNYESALTVSRQISGRLLDLERLCARLALDKASPRDLLGVEISLRQILDLRRELQNQNLPFEWELDLNESDLLAMENDWERLSRAILREPAAVLNEGQLIQDGWNEELDNLRHLRNHSQEVLDRYLEEEKSASNLPQLKLKYNRIIGYFFELSKSKADILPDHFQRSQSLLGTERFTTPKLRELEETLLNAQDRQCSLERQLFLGLREELKSHIEVYKRACDFAAEIDVTQSFAWAAIRNRYVKPELKDDGTLILINGRHPVVENSLRDEPFVPNSVSFEGAETLFLLTGPNMAGKSTYLRQTALIVLMGQVGSFVPADSAQIGIVDRIFCRVGASDHLARGESTFLVEMNETAQILRNATERSLVIMDEVGRGTSTRDGFSLAWAICEYLLDTVRAKTLFATHFHELTALSHPRLHNFSMAVLEDGADVVFLRKVVDGVADHSYGIYVAQLAGIPVSVLDRARFILSNLTPEEKTVPAQSSSVSATPLAETEQMSLFRDEELLKAEILSIPLNAISPLEALNRLDVLQKKLQKRPH